MTQALDVMAEVRAIAGELRVDAAERDLAAGTPWPQRERIRASGLLKLMVPLEFGGYGADWPTAMRSIRELATADASLAHLFGYHHLAVVTPHLIGTPEQRAHWYTLTARDNLFWGNALNPLDPRTRLVRPLLNGTKSFCTGAQGSDLLLVSATEEGQSRLQVAVLPTRRQGITVHDDWANMGQRQTDSGSVTFEDVDVHDSELLGPPGAGGSVLASLRPCITQSILSNLFLGLAQGALRDARAYTLAMDKPFVGSTAERPSEDPYILAHYGDMYVAVHAGECLLDLAAERLPGRVGARRRADYRRARRVRSRRRRRKSRGGSHRARRHEPHVRGHGRAGHDGALPLRSLLAQRAHHDAARPAGLQVARSRRLVPERSPADAVVLFVATISIRAA